MDFNSWEGGDISVVYQQEYSSVMYYFLLSNIGFIWKIELFGIANNILASAE